MTFENYINSEVEYEDGFLLDIEGRVIMSTYEEPIMRVAAEVVTQNGGDILNVGFGLGIIDHHIQLKKPKSHTIIEANKHIYREAIKNGWDKNVELLNECWTVSIDRFIKEGRKFDGIYWDIIGYERPDKATTDIFISKLKHILKDDGIFSYFINTRIDNIQDIVNNFAKENIYSANQINIQLTYDDEKLKNRGDYDIKKDHFIPIVRFKKRI